MPLIENFTSYTETDPNAHIAVTASRVTWSLQNRNEDAYVYKDKGAAYFSDNFNCKLTVKFTDGATLSASVILGVWSITNLIDDLNGIDTANGDFLAIISANNTTVDYALQMVECDAGTQYLSTAYTLTPTGYTSPTVYLTIVRDEAVGTYGTLYLYIYSDAARTTLLNTQSLALHTSKKDFRYIFTSHSWNTGEASLYQSGYAEGLEVTVTSSPSVTTEPVTALTNTTATGNGTIVNIGAATVSQHGHCWGTSVNPTTADSKTTNGAGVAGAFTSAITGLVWGQKYYVRAYATNSIGTSYGQNISFTAGYIGTQLIPGQFAVKGTTIRYAGYDGIPYVIQGTPE